MQANQNKPVKVGVIFHPNSPPRADLDLFMSKILEIHDKISNENKTAYLMGDYNINLLNFDSHQRTNDFIDSVIAQGYIPHITKPTRITQVLATVINHLFIF